jgi:membrane AbrB-like protein
MAIGGASEMASQAQRHGGQVERVAAAHSLRIMLVVLIVPLSFNLLQVHGLDPYVPLARSFDPIGFAVLVAVTLGAAVAMERFGSPNSWMIGPLLTAAAITATGHTFSSLPAVVVNAGQLLIGVSLGTHFTAEFFRAAPRYLAAVALITLAYLLSAVAFGMLLAHGAGLHWSTAVIATTPGGIGEMALTAQALQLGVPVVTAFHAIRMAAVVLTAGVVFAVWRRLMTRSGHGH